MKIADNLRNGLFNSEKLVGEEVVNFYRFVFVNAFGVWIVVYMHQGMDSWAMMGQAIEEGKGFLRIRLGADGALTVYSIVTEELLEAWIEDPGIAPGRRVSSPWPA